MAGKATAAVAVDAALNAAIDAEVPAPLAAIIEPPVDAVAATLAARIEETVARDLAEARNYIRAHFGHHEDVAVALAADVPIEDVHALVQAHTQPEEAPAS